MTIETCKKRMELAEAKGNDKEVAYWKERIERKLRQPKYANVAAALPKKDGKKSKG